MKVDQNFGLFSGSENNRIEKISKSNPYAKKNPFSKKSIIKK